MNVVVAVIVENTLDQAVLKRDLLFFSRWSGLTLDLVDI